MKKLAIILLFLSIGKCTIAQTLTRDNDIRSANSNLPYYKIDTVVSSNYSKSQLYSNALTFLSASFNDSRSVVEQKDAELGEITFRGSTYRDSVINMSANPNKVDNRSVKYRLYFKCKLYFKDNKFKIVLSTLEYPFTPLMNLGMNLPVQKSEPGAPNRVAKELAFALVRDISNKIDRKPENDF